MKNIVKSAIQTAAIGLAVGGLLIFEKYDNDSRVNYPTKKFVAKGELESGQRYMIIDSHPDRMKDPYAGDNRQIHLYGLGNIDTSPDLTNDYVQTFNISNEKGKLVLLNDDYILATNRAKWYSDNTIANPELRGNMIDLANKVLKKERINTVIKEGSPDLVTAWNREKATKAN